jgi:glycosyltransferase involved in cell wall biosynthesis
MFFHRARVYGGAEVSLSTNAFDFVSRGYEVSVVCACDGVVPTRFEEAGLKVHRLFPRGHRRRRERRCVGRLIESFECRSKSSSHAWMLRLGEATVRAERRLLLQVLARERPSVFYTNMAASGDAPFLRTAAGCGVATISHQRVTPPVFAGRRLLQETNTECDLFVSNSQWTRSEWIRAGLRADRHEVIYNAIARPEPTSESLRERLGLPASAKLIVSVGRLDPQKDFARGVRVFSRIAARYPEWHYVVIGEGEARGELERLRAATGLRHRVHLAGEVKNAATFLSQAEVFLHPTTAEHFGRVVAEAMLAGALAVGHASGGVKEMVEHERTGLLFDDDDSLERSLDRAMRGSVADGMREKAARAIADLCGPANAERLASLVAMCAATRRSG